MDVVVGEDIVYCCVVILFDSGGCGVVGRKFDGGGVDVVVGEDSDDCVAVDGVDVVVRKDSDDCGYDDVDGINDVDVDEDAHVSV